MNCVPNIDSRLNVLMEHSASQIALDFETGRDRRYIPGKTKNAIV